MDLFHRSLQDAEIDTEFNRQDIIESENGFSSIQSSQTASWQDDPMKLRAPHDQFAVTSFAGELNESQSMATASSHSFPEAFSWLETPECLHHIDSFINYSDPITLDQEEEEMTLRKRHIEKEEVSNDSLPNHVSLAEQNPFITPEVMGHSDSDLNESFGFCQENHSNFSLDQVGLRSSDHSSLEFHSSSLLASPIPVLNCAQQRHPKQNLISSMCDKFSSKGEFHSENNEVEEDSECTDVRICSKAQNWTDRLKNSNSKFKENKDKFSPLLISSESNDGFAPKFDLLGVDEVKTCCNGGMRVTEKIKVANVTLNCQKEKFPVTEQGSFPFLHATHMDSGLNNNEFAQNTKSTASQDKGEACINDGDENSVNFTIDKMDKGSDKHRASKTFFSNSINTNIFQLHQILSSQQEEHPYTVKVPVPAPNQSFQFASFDSNIQKDEFEIHPNHQSAPTILFPSLLQTQSDHHQTKQQPSSLTITPHRVQRVQRGPFLHRTPLSHTKTLFPKSNMSPIGHNHFPNMLPYQHLDSSGSFSCSPIHAERECDSSSPNQMLSKHASPANGFNTYYAIHSSPYCQVSSPVDSRPSSSDSSSFSSFHAPSPQGSEVISPSPLKRKYSPVRSSVTDNETSPVTSRTYSTLSSDISSPPPLQNNSDSDPDNVFGGFSTGLPKKRRKIVVIGPSVATRLKSKESCERKVLQDQENFYDEDTEEEEMVESHCDEESESLQCANVLMSLGQGRSNDVSFSSEPASSLRAQRFARRSGGNIQDQSLLQYKEPSRDVKPKKARHHFPLRNRKSDQTSKTPPHRPPLSKTGIRSFPAQVSLKNGEDSMVEEYPMFYRRFPVSTLMDEDTRMRIFGISSIHQIHEIQDEDLRQAAFRSFKKSTNGGFKQPESLLDLYTARFTRGIGNGKEGLCPICYEEGHSIWLKTKTSQYNYHLTVQHGISPRTKLPMDPPLEFRMIEIKTQNDELRNMRQGKCHSCKRFIDLESIRDGSVNVPEIYFWKHAKQCHDRVGRLEGSGETFVENELYRRVLQFEQEQQEIMQAFNTRF